METKEEANNCLLSVLGLGRRDAASDRWLLRHAELEIRAGDRLALTGSTGSGKSVFLRSLALLDPVEEGTIRWQGATVKGTDIPAFRRRVVYLHQKPALIPQTVEDNLRLPFQLGIAGQSPFPEEKATELLQSLHRESDFLRQRVSLLSGGEAQITAVIRALLFEPSILLLDEPTAALDPEATASVEELILGWHSEKTDRAYLWVSHDDVQARRLGYRALRMEAGTLREEESP